MTTVADMVRALREVTKAEAVAVINRDGGVIAATLPPSVSQETFSIMCAAILGAGMTAATELQHAPPHSVVLEAEDSTMLIREVGRRHMLVLVLPSEARVADFGTAIGRFVQAAEHELG